MDNFELDEDALGFVTGGNNYNTIIEQLRNGGTYTLKDGTVLTKETLDHLGVALIIEKLERDAYYQPEDHEVEDDCSR